MSTADTPHGMRLARFIGARIVVVLAVGLAVSAVTFFVLRVSRDPVDTVAGARSIDIREPADRAALAEELGTDRSLISQYWSWLGDAVGGDLGASYLRSSNEVGPLITQALPVNLELVVLAQLMSLVVSIPLGLWAGARAGRLGDRAVTTLSTALVSYPGFALAIVLISIFAVRLDLFPVTAANFVPFTDDPVTNLQQMFLPALSLALPMMGVYTRVLRSDVATTLQEEFVLMARSKGLSERYILLRHVLRPSSLSLIPLVGLQSGALLGGSILVERLFAFPYGLGSALVNAALAADTPVVLGVATTIGVAFAVVTVTADAISRFADPRISGG